MEGTNIGLYPQENQRNLTKLSKICVDKYQTYALQNNLSFENNFWIQNFTLCNQTEEAGVVARNWSLAIYVVLGIVLFTLCLVTFIGNSLVLHAVRTDRRLQTVSNMFIVSLAVADLVVGLIVMPISAVYIFTETWHFGNIICDIWISVDYIASTASILNLFILSLDRYWSVTSPLKYLRKRTKKRAFIMIGFVWCCSSLWIIPIVGWHHFLNGGVRTVPSDTCDTEYATNFIFKVITGLFNFYIPLVIMYILYGKIFHEIRKRSAFELGRSNGGGGGGYFTSINLTVVDDSDGRNETFAELTPPSPSPSPTSPSQDEMETHSERNDYDFDTSDEGDFHKKYEYSNVALLRATEKKLPHQSTFKREYHYNVDYSYDERVVDPSTERVHQILHMERIVQTYTIENPDESPRKCIIQEKRNSETKNKKCKKPIAITKINSGIKHSIRRANKEKPSNGIRPRTYSNSRNLQANHHSPNQVKSQTNEALRKVAAIKNIGQKLRRKPKRTSVSLSKEIKAARQLGVIMGAFTLCFLPYFIIFMVVAFCNGCVNPDIMTTFTWIGYMNSTLNPCLYPLCNAGFRRSFKRMFSLRRQNSSRKYLDPRQFD